MKSALLLIIFTACAGSAVAADEATVELGKLTYERWCAICHAPGLPGAMALEAKYNGSKPALLDERTDLAPAVTKVVVRKGVSIMPFFRKTEVSDKELDALAAYLARNNKSAAK